MKQLAFADVTLLAAATVAVALQAVLGDRPYLPTIMLALIVLFGMPHGGLDLVLARRLWPIRTTVRLLIFLSLYLLLAAFVIAVWMISPTAALAIFLVYSALHFSEDWPVGTWRLGGVAGGFLVLSLPAMTDIERTGDLFSALGASGSEVASVLAMVGVPAGVLFCLASISEPKALLRMAFLIACSFVLPPLAYFFVFFCGLHAVQHVHRVNRALNFGWRESSLVTLGPTILALAMLAVAGVLLMTRQHALSETLMRVIFVGFAALTVPHMLLVDRFRARKTSF